MSTATRYVTSGLIDQAQYMQFCEAYGSDVTTWTGFSLLRDIRELRVTCYVAQLAAEHERYVGKATTATVAAHTLLRTCLTGT